MQYLKFLVKQCHECINRIIRIGSFILSLNRVFRENLISWAVSSAVPVSKIPPEATHQLLSSGIPSIKMVHIICYLAISILPQIILQLLFFISITYIFMLKFLQMQYFILYFFIDFLDNIYRQEALESCLRPSNCCWEDSRILPPLEAMSSWCPLKCAPGSRGLESRYRDILSFHAVGIIVYQQKNCLVSNYKRKFCKRLQ